MNFSSLFMVALVAVLFAYFACTADTVGVMTPAARRLINVAEASSVLDSACRTTLYSDVCMSTLQTHNHPQSGGSLSVKDMAITSVKVSLQEVQKLSNIPSSTYSTSLGSVYSVDNDEGTRAAIQDCEMLLRYTVRQLNNSLELLTNSVEWKKEQAEDVQTWLSASLNDLDTCMQHFQAQSNQSRLPNRARNVSKVVSNSLAIVNTLSLTNISSAHKNRRLLSRHHQIPWMEDGFPAWMSPTDRRLLQTSPVGVVPADTVVAQDGTGNYRTISEAVKAAPSNGNRRYVIHVKAGVYAEMVDVSNDNIMLIGDGKDVTVVTGSKSGASLNSIATFAATGDGFIARDMGFANTAGAGKEQAIALRVASDRSVFYHCSIKANQDTLYAYSMRQFYRECDIYGTVDFIFGNAAAVFQSCNIVSLNRGGSGANYITAQGRTDPNQNTGFSIHNCQVTGSIRTYLGRPWKQYSRTVFMQSSLDSSIDPAGWSEWSGSSSLKTLYYGEYMNSGPGAGTAKRVTWPGYHIITTAAEASQFTVGQLISGNSWLPSTGVAFQSGL